VPRFTCLCQTLSPEPFVSSVSDDVIRAPCAFVLRGDSLCPLLAVPSDVYASIAPAVWPKGCPVLGSQRFIADILILCRLDFTCNITWETLLTLRLTELGDRLFMGPSRRRRSTASTAIVYHKSQPAGWVNDIRQAARSLEDRF
jgi:hypothetical protein